MNQEIQNFEPSDNFDQQIFDELLKQGLKGDELISAFEEKKSKIPSAIESIKSQAREIAQDKAEYYTYDEVFTDEK